MFYQIIPNLIILNKKKTLEAFFFFAVAYGLTLGCHSK